MNTSKSPVRSTVLMAVLTFGLSACAACGPGYLPEGAGGSGDGGTPGSLATRDGGMLPCEEDPLGCGDAYPEGPGGSGTGVGAVSVTFANSLPVQATFYASGGGANATKTYYVTQWLPAGASSTLTNAMEGPLGAPLSMTTQLHAESFPKYTHECWVTPTTAQTLCTIRAERNADGFAVLSCSCVAQ